MHHPAPRLTAVLGVTRATLTTLGPSEAVRVLLAEFGWDATFLSLALLRDDEAMEAFGLVWERLLLHPLEDDLDVPVH